MSVPPLTVREVDRATTGVVVRVVHAGWYETLEHRFEIAEQQRPVLVDQQTRGRVPGLNGQHSLTQPQPLHDRGQHRRGLDPIRWTLLETRFGLRGGRRWWAHLAFTRLNIELIIHRNQIEERLDLVAAESFSGRN